jgi:hypothetical protein
MNAGVADPNSIIVYQELLAPILYSCKFFATNLLGGVGLLGNSALYISSDTARLQIGSDFLSYGNEG